MACSAGVVEAKMHFSCRPRDLSIVAAKIRPHTVETGTVRLSSESPPPIKYSFFLFFLSPRGAWGFCFGGVFRFLLCKCVILGHMARSSITTLTGKNHQARARSNKIFILVSSENRNKTP